MLISIAFSFSVKMRDGLTQKANSFDREFLNTFNSSRNQVEILIPKFRLNIYFSTDLVFIGFFLFHVMILLPKKT